MFGLYEEDKGDEGVFGVVAMWVLAAVWCVLD